MVSFDTGLVGDPLTAADVTDAERAERATHYITGTAHPDPGWTGKLSISKQHDQAWLVLDAQATTKWPRTGEFPCGRGRAGPPGRMTGCC